MNRLTRTLLQLVEDLENQLDSALKSCNMLDRLNQQLDECNQKNEDLMVQLQAAQRELERPQLDLRDYQKTIRLLQDQINTLRNKPPAPGPWDNQIVSLPGVGFVLAIDLYRKGWLEQQINSLTRTAPMLLPTYNDWWYEHGKIHGWAPPQPPPPTPGLPSAPPVPTMPGLPTAPPVTLSDDQSHWVAVPDNEPDGVDPYKVPESLQSFRQRNRAKPTHDE